MNEALPIIGQIFTQLFLGLAFLSFMSTSVSLRGQPRPLSSHPFVVRLRFFAFGLFVALLHQGYDWENPGLFGFITATLLLATAIRYPEMAAFHIEPTSEAAAHEGTGNTSRD